MKKILIVRLSALGDVIHAMPALSDIHRRWPDAMIDVATDERFVEIPQQHRHVNQVISLPLKRLKRNLLRLDTLSELRAVIRRLRAEEYDIVIDMHGLMKSALVTRLARARERVGFDVSQCAERGAARFYQRHFMPGHIPNRVQWMRDLAAFAVGADSSAPIDFGLGTHAEPNGSSRQVVFFHSASREDRCWAESAWVALGRALVEDGYAIELPWGTPAEQQRAERLKQAIGEACSIPRLRSMKQWMEQFAATALVVGVDSGLTHLAAAVGVRSVAIFNASCPGLLVPQHGGRALALGRNGQAPELDDVLQACRGLLGPPSS